MAILSLMKPRLILVLSLAFLAGCSTAKQAGKSAAPETVLVTYHVKSGSEADFELVLKEAWQVYRREHLVYAEPHVIVRGKDKGDKPKLVEIFTWIDGKTPDDPPAAVKEAWDKMMPLCEARDGYGPLEIDVVETVVN
jgi:hypothetical protein